MINLFLAAARRKFRFPSSRGELTVEQLFDLPLTSQRGPSLDNVARAVNADLRNAGEETFVALADNSARNELALKLDVVKEVIRIRQEENATERARSERREKKQRLLEALEAAENREIGAKTPEEIRQMIAALDD